MTVVGWNDAERALHAVTGVRFAQPGQIILGAAPDELTTVTVWRWHTGALHFAQARVLPAKQPGVVQSV